MLKLNKFFQENDKNANPNNVHINKTIEWKIRIIVKNIGCVFLDGKHTELLS